jgi:hypothetical protein
VVKAIRIIAGETPAGYFSPDMYFFMGFLALSAIFGLISIFIPLGYPVLGCVFLISLVLLFISRKEISNSLRTHIRIISDLTVWEKVFLIFLFIFILASVVQKITLGDTESYHAQSIQWVRKYAVVPGLGNIHGRLAFNSMFLVISALFSFQIKDVLIFPLNGLCYLVVAFKLFFLYKSESKPGTSWKALLYILLLLISLLILIPDLNSPAADIICATLIIYTFVLIISFEAKEIKRSIPEIVFFNAVVFSCVTFKISSLFLVLSLFFLLKEDPIRRILITAIVGFLIVAPFITRNYFLSGYLIYPFPAIDIFNVDWKIPLGNALSEKFEIESWAKISTIPTADVIHMGVSEWIGPWLHSLNLMYKLLIAINLFSVISVILMFLKKKYFLLKVQFIIIFNLIFWFFSAPDPRFAYGFLFVGFSFNLAYFSSLIESERLFKYMPVGIFCFLSMILFQRIMPPVNTLKHPAQWVIPSSFGTVATNEYFADFNYRVPVPGGGCFNVEIPCVPFPLSGVGLRGKDFTEGFKIISNQLK